MRGVPSSREVEVQCDAWLEIDGVEGYCCKPLGHESVHHLDGVVWPSDEVDLTHADLELVDPLAGWSS